jgi:AraC-like DNA-binding protein
MPLIANPLNLLDVALNAGYADSTHFSHSIRQFYGYTPRDIFAGSRRLAIFSQP